LARNAFSQSDRMPQRTITHRVAVLTTDHCYELRWLFASGTLLDPAKAKTEACPASRPERCLTAGRCRA
jgi:hypothetical protein